MSMAMNKDYKGINRNEIVFEEWDGRLFYPFNMFNCLYYFYKIKIKTFKLFSFCSFLVQFSPFRKVPNT